MVHPKGRTYLFATLKFLYIKISGHPSHPTGQEAPQLEIIEYPIANTEYPMSKLRFSDGNWRLSVGYWVFKTLKFLYVQLSGLKPQL
jgi:hypothetical protein